VCVCVCVYVFACVCVLDRERDREREETEERVGEEDVESVRGEDEGGGGVYEPTDHTVIYDMTKYHSVILAERVST